MAISTILMAIASAGVWMVSVLTAGPVLAGTVAGLPTFGVEVNLRQRRHAGSGVA